MGDNGPLHFSLDIDEVIIKVKSKTLHFEKLHPLFTIFFKGPSSNFACSVQCKPETPIALNNLAVQQFFF